MGRIKSTMVKRAASSLLKEENIFNDSFEHNKNLLKGSMPSKSIRNKIAGYLARLKKPARPINPKTLEPAKE
jgi:ribosomal protein S17E